MQSHRQLKRKLLKDPATRKAYEALGPKFALIEAIIKKRIEKGLNQASLARRNIRLCGVNRSGVSH